MGGQWKETVGGARSACYQDGKGRGGSEQEVKKLLETCMDSCMPSTGAEEDSFERVGKAPATSSRRNSQLLQFKLHFPQYTDYL